MRLSVYSLEPPAQPVLSMAAKVEMESVPLALASTRCVTRPAIAVILHTPVVRMGEDMAIVCHQMQSNEEHSMPITLREITMLREMLLTWTLLKTISS